jgi:hypothetical protein
MAIEKVIVVLAGNKQEYEKYLEDQHLSSSQAVFGDTTESMIRLRVSSIVTVGTFWDRPDAWPLQNMAESRLR